MQKSGGKELRKKQNGEKIEMNRILHLQHLETMFLRDIYNAFPTSNAALLLQFAQQTQGVIPWYLKDFQIYMTGITGN